MGRKCICITGAGTGLGRAAAVCLARRGHRVLAGTVSEAEAGEITALGRAEQLPLEGLKLDVTSPVDREKLAAIEVDVLMNNAGVGFSGSMAELDVGLMRRNFEVNVFAAVELSQVALRGMIRRERGTVLFVSSLGGRKAFPFLGAYCGSKYALQAVAECLRAEMQSLGKNVQVSLIEPGPYHTGFNQAINYNKFDAMEKGSYWTAAQIKELKEGDAAALKALEEHDLSTILDKIVEACEAAEPEVRYCAPEGIFASLVKPDEVARFPAAKPDPPGCYSACTIS